MERRSRLTVSLMALYSEATLGTMLATYQSSPEAKNVKAAGPIMAEVLDFVLSKTENTTQAFFVAQLLVMELMAAMHENPELLAGINKQLASLSMQVLSGSKMVS